MPLSNAERRRRFLARRKATGAVITLTPQQIADRAAVASEAIYPVPRHIDIPRFLGWSRYDWSATPEALVELVGLHDAWRAWQAERVAMDDQCAAAAPAGCVPETTHIYIEDLEVRDSMRALDPSIVAGLASSIRATGAALAPIVIWWSTDSIGEPLPVLVSGRHRAAACQQVGIDRVPCLVAPDEIASRLMQISENLHRADLTPRERAQHQERWLAVCAEIAARPAATPVPVRKRARR